MQPESLDSEVGMQCSQGHWTVRWGCSVARVIGQGGGDAVQPGSLDSEVGMQCSQGHWTVRWGCSVARVIVQ